MSLPKSTLAEVAARSDYSRTAVIQGLGADALRNAEQVLDRTQAEVACLSAAQAEVSSLANQVGILTQPENMVRKGLRILQRRDVVAEGLRLVVKMDTLLDAIRLSVDCLNIQRSALATVRDFIAGAIQDGRLLRNYLDEKSAREVSARMANLDQMTILLSMSIRSVDETLAVSTPQAAVGHIERSLVALTERHGEPLYDLPQAAPLLDYLRPNIDTNRDL